MQGCLWEEVLKGPLIIKISFLCSFYYKNTKTKKVVYSALIFFYLEKNIFLNF